MNLIIESCLSEPPSEIYCFRDVTLYARTYVFDDILLECPSGTRTMYWEWLKAYGAHDFISYLIRNTEEERGYTIKTANDANITVDRIDVRNLNEIILRLKSLR
jgi:hypothetical protein